MALINLQGCNPSLLSRYSLRQHSNTQIRSFQDQRTQEQGKNKNEPNFFVTFFLSLEAMWVHQDGEKLSLGSDTI